MPCRARASHLVVLFVVYLVVSVVVSAMVSSVAAAAPCWRPPAPGIIVDPFREPPCPYCRGNRGIEYRVQRSTPVLAVAAGEVTWSGTIAGVRWVVVRHANGWQTTYGRLVSSALRRGDRVVARSRLGVASGQLYFGLRINDRYVDPEPFLGRAIGRPRLVPVDGTPPRRPPVPQWRCGR